MSSMKRPAPRRSVLSSTRATARPMKVRAVSLPAVVPCNSFTRSRPLDLLDHGAPLREFVPHVLVGAVGPIAQHRLEARFNQLGLERLVGPFGLGHFVELLEDGLGRTNRRKNSKED